MKNGYTVILLALCASTLAVAACSSDTPAKSGTGGSSGSQTGTGGSSSSAVGVALTPDMTGWVDKASNTLGVQGAWYTYSDATGVASCTGTGKHMASECSMITMPPASATGFPNTGGVMCTAGSVEMVIGTPPDYSNMWGAGIGLDLASSGGALSTKGEFDASKLKGISFDIDTVPGPGLRVEFPSAATDAGTAGGDYWGATASYPNSPVMKGTNTVLWSAIAGPMGHMFTPAHIESIQFHVPTTLSAGGSYSFCISNLKMLM